MVIHKYKGNKMHTFRESNEPCAWCKQYVRSGHELILSNEKFKNHSIETPYCSPKCFFEDKRIVEGYFESVVLSFLNLGGEQEYLRQEISKNIEWKQRKIKDEQAERKIEEIKLKAKRWKPIGFIIGVLIGLLIFKLFGVI